MALRCFGGKKPPMQALKDLDDGVNDFETTLRRGLTEFSELFHVSKTGLLIQTSLGRAGGLGVV
jgi:hypothetical protein